MSGDKAVKPGDLVTRFINDCGKKTQRGYCKLTKQWFTVRILGTNKCLQNVPMNRFDYLQKFNPGDAVCLDEQYGRIDSINYKVKMQSECGSIVEIDSSQYFDDFECGDLKLGKFYPGQVVSCVPSLLEHAVWLRKNRRMSVRQPFTIQTIIPNRIVVLWYNQNGLTEEECSQINGDDINRLKVIPFIDSASFKIGNLLILQLQQNDLNDNDVDDEHSWYSIEDDDDVDDDDVGDDVDGSVYFFIATNTEFKPKCTPGSLVTVEIINIDSYATIVWQDGTQENYIPTNELYVSKSSDDHEFFPGDWARYNNRKYGIIQKVDSIERIAEIKWLDYSKELRKPIQAINHVISITQQISVYELNKIEMYLFRPGDAVRRKPIQMNLIGKVVDTCLNGYVIIKWMDNQIEYCWPQNLQVLPYDEDDPIYACFPDNDDDDDSNNNSSSDDDDDDDELLLLSWPNEKLKSLNGDLILENLATKVLFIMERLSKSRELFRNVTTTTTTINQKFNIIKKLLLIYEKSCYLDKYLGTLFFNLDSRHFQLLLSETKQRANIYGIKLHGRLFSNNHFITSSTSSSLTNDHQMEYSKINNIQKMIKLVNQINLQITNHTDLTTTPDIYLKLFVKTEDDLCVELFIMLICRLNLVYAEFVSCMSRRDGLSILKNTIERPLSSTTITIEKMIKDIEFDNFIVVNDAPITHHYYYNTEFQPNDLTKILNILENEYCSFRESLPFGIYIKIYKDRIDLLSLMIIGPKKTPYEDGIFLFDIQLTSDYPITPPSVHYISYIQQQFNPKLYVDGRVGVWRPYHTLTQLIVSIQILIFVPEPYYNEYSNKRQSLYSQQHSRIYNEFVLLKLIQSMTVLLRNLPNIFHMEIIKHIDRNGMKMYRRFINYLTIDKNKSRSEFPLQPISKGLQLSLKKALEKFQQVLKKTLEIHMKKTKK